MLVSGFRGFTLQAIVGTAALLSCVPTSSPSDLGPVWGPAELMRARVGIAYVGMSSNPVSNPALAANVAGTRFSMATDVAVYSGKHGLKVLSNVYQKRRLLEACFENPKQTWSDVEQAFDDMPHEWGLGGVRIGILEYAAKGFVSNVESYISESVKLDLDPLDSTLYLHQGASMLLVWNFALARYLVEQKGWLLSAGLGGRLWGYLNLQPALLKSIEALKGRVTRPSSKAIWMEGRHGYGFGGDLGLIVRRPSRGLSLALRVRNVVSSYSGVTGSRRIDGGFDWRPFARARYALARSVTLVGDLRDIWPHFLRNVRPGFALGLTWQQAELWVGRNGGTTTAGIGICIGRLSFGYAVLSSWNPGLPTNGVSRVVYLKISP